MERTSTQILQSKRNTLMNIGNVNVDRLLIDLGNILYDVCGLTDNVVDQLIEVFLGNPTYLL